MIDGAEEFLTEMEKSVGKEKAEEMLEDHKFLLDEFQDQILGAEIAFDFMIEMSTNDFEVRNAVRATVISSMEFYRDWLSQKGIDVRKLEGRNG